MDRICLSKQDIYYPVSSVITLMLITAAIFCRPSIFHPCISLFLFMFPFKQYDYVNICNIIRYYVLGDFVMLCISYH